MNVSEHRSVGNNRNYSVKRRYTYRGVKEIMVVATCINIDIYISLRNLDTSFEIFSCPYLFVFVKVSIKNFTLIGNLQYIFDITKFWRYLIGLFPLKAFHSSAPYLYSVTRPIPVYSVAVIASPPVKQTVHFQTDLL